MHARGLMATAALVVLPCCAGAFDTGRLEGHITDQNTGRPVVAASVQLEGTRLGVQSDSDGYYRMRLSPGQYTPKVSAVGYLTCVTESLVIRAGQVTTRDFRLSQRAMELNQTIKVRAIQEPMDSFGPRVTTKPRSAAPNHKPGRKVDALLEQVAGIPTTQTGEVFVRGGRAGETLAVIASLNHVLASANIESRIRAAWYDPEREQPPEPNPTWRLPVFWDSLSVASPVERETSILTRHLITLFLCP